MEYRHLNILLPGLCLFILLGCSIPMKNTSPDRMTGDSNCRNAVATALQNADPEEGSRYMYTIFEAMHFFKALFSTNALPSVPNESHGNFTVLPSSPHGTNIFAMSYPFSVDVNLTLTNGTLCQQIYVMQKPTGTGAWNVVKGWQCTTNWQRIGRTDIPSQLAQDIANETAVEDMKSFHEK